jgi:putative ABC transport system permease protein
MAVALGVAAAAAVLTGALLVGDSVRGSQRFLALDRLGQIDELLIVDRFFREELAEELASQPNFTSDYSLAVPAILFPSGTVESASGDDRRRAGKSSGSSATSAGRMSSRRGRARSCSMHLWPRSSRSKLASK